MMYVFSIHPPTVLSKIYIISGIRGPTGTAVEASGSNIELELENERREDAESERRDREAAAKNRQRAEEIRRRRGFTFGGESGVLSSVHGNLGSGAPLFERTVVPSFNIGTPRPPEIQGTFPKGVQGTFPKANSKAHSKAHAKGGAGGNRRSPRSPRSSLNTPKASPRGSGSLSARSHLGGFHSARSNHARNSNLIIGDKSRNSEFTFG
jgi:hypothetical protein